jgi:hypothetical protein
LKSSISGTVLARIRDLVAAPGAYLPIRNTATASNRADQRN